MRDWGRWPIKRAGKKRTLLSPRESNPTLFRDKKKEEFVNGKAQKTVLLFIDRSRKNSTRETGGEERRVKTRSQKRGEGEGRFSIPRPSLQSHLGGDKGLAQGGRKGSQKKQGQHFLEDRKGRRAA